MLTDDGGSRSRSGGLSISLSSPDGRVIGGGVGGLLIAATPVQVTSWDVLLYFMHFISGMLLHFGHMCF